MIFFTADLHFGHTNIIKMCNRPFSSVEEMNEEQIRKWNNKVRGNDTVYVLGDMFFRCKNAEEILSRLKGRKRLVTGNHDNTWMSKIDATKYFISIEKYMEISDGSRGITLCHYPQVTWKHPSKSYMVHGHIHNDVSAEFWKILASNERILNAGVDINGFEPVTLDEMIENNKKWKEINPY